MAGYYEDDDDDYTGPYRAAPAQFDTMNMGPGPHRVPQFDTSNMGAAPHRASQFDTMNLNPPVRVPDPPPVNTKPAADAGRPASPFHGYNNDGGQTPMNPASVETPSAGTGDGGRMHSHLVIANLAVRAAAVVALIVGVAVLASTSQTVDDGTVSYSRFSSFKYALAAAIIGAAYSIYETVSAGLRLAMGHPLLPGYISLFVSYIGDQVVIVLLLSGASAAAATLKDLHLLQIPDSTGRTYCQILDSFCKQGAGAAAIIFVGFAFVAAGLLISSYCFYKRRT